MRSTTLYIAACLLAALVPWMPNASKLQGGQASLTAFPGWPTEFEGRALTSLPLEEREQRFSDEFPGRIARFTDGRREIIMRWVVEATRKLHPASDCFEGVGYGVAPLPLKVDEAGARWGSFIATRGEERLRVRERIYDDRGGAWSDVSAWYWTAARERSAGPWWAVTVAEREPKPAP